MQYLLANPHVFDSLPNDFELVILPRDDPELCLYNLKLLDAHSSEGKPIVFVRIKSSQEIDFQNARPDVYVPVAV